MIIRLSSAAVFILLTLSSFAQSGNVEMAEGMRSSGKIWVVVAVLLVIFAGIVLYLIYLERKVKKLEDEQDK